MTVLAIRNYHLEQGSLNPRLPLFNKLPVIELGLAVQKLVIAKPAGVKANRGFLFVLFRGYSLREAKLKCRKEAF